MSNTNTEMSRGGKRKGAGRKPVEDKKQPISLYVRKSEIEELGGKRKVKEICLKSVKKRLEGRKG